MSLPECKPPLLEQTWVGSFRLSCPPPPSVQSPWKRRDEMHQGILEFAWACSKLNVVGMSLRGHRHKSMSGCDMSCATGRLNKHPSRVDKLLDCFRGVWIMNEMLQAEHRIWSDSRKSTSSATHSQHPLPAICLHHINANCYWQKLACQDFLPADYRHLLTCVINRTHHTTAPKIYR